MNESTTRELLTAVETLKREFHLFRDATESRFDFVGERLDRRIEPTLGQHGSALLELAADMTSVQAMLGVRRGKPERIERPDPG